MTTIYCPYTTCGSNDTVEFAKLIPITHDDYAPFVRCNACDEEWELVPPADPACRECGGSGDHHAREHLGQCLTCIPVGSEWRR